MDALQEAIQKCQVPLKFDNRTEGSGNCFPNAIVQQLRRPAVKSWLQTRKPSAIFSNQQTLRNRVSNFATKSQLPIILNYKSHFGNQNWIEYWNRMSREGTWVDSHFVQFTAFYIELDIYIITPSSKPGNPFIKIQGNISNMEIPSPGPKLFLGNYTNVHYQSLLPIENIFSLELQPTSIEKDCLNMQWQTESKIEMKLSKEQSANDRFIYTQNGDQYVFLEEEGKFKCPMCNISFARIVSHINSTKCEIQRNVINIQEFKNQLNSYKEGFRLASSRKRKAKSRMKLRVEKGSQEVKEAQAKQKVNSRMKLREERGSQEVKSGHAKHQAKSDRSSPNKEKSK